MKIEEAVQYMSKQPLERTLKSVTDYPAKKSIEEYRDLVNKNASLLSDSDKIRQNFENYIDENSSNPYENRLLYGFIIRSIISQPDYSSTETLLIKTVTEREESIISLSKKKGSFKHIDSNSKEIFSVVLETALEDDKISYDELALLNRLRKKLSLTEKDQFLIQAELGLFPSKKKNAHTFKEISNAINDLQKMGILFFCNRLDDIEESLLVIPDEVVPGIKSVIGVELIENKYRLLLDIFQNKHLKAVLKSRGLQSSGVTDELVDRVIHSGIQPSEALECLTTTELSDLCSQVPSLNVSGTKRGKIDRLINYYSKLVLKKFVEDNTGSKYYEYLEELAIRDLDNLVANNIVKDQDFIDKAFENGTTYLFEEKLNLKTIDFNGSEHADGGVVFEAGDSIMLWDNKSRKDGKPFEFPNKHLEQFLRYIQNESKSGRRVNLFLIITSSVDPSCEKNAVILKSKSGVDTDIALISAEHLKLVAENWKKHSIRNNFDLNILNTTGILDWDTLRERMSWHD